MITEAIARLVSNDSAGAVAKILREGIALGTLYKIAGKKADKTEVEENND